MDSDRGFLILATLCLMTLVSIVANAGGVVYCKDVRTGEISVHEWVCPAGTFQIGRSK